MTTGDAWRIKVFGLKGGHSGVDIHQGRGNAMRILGATLQRVLDELPAELADMNGGSAQNAIPREASAVVVARSRIAKATEASGRAAAKTSSKTRLGQLSTPDSDHRRENRAAPRR